MSSPNVHLIVNKLLRMILSPSSDILGIAHLRSRLRVKRTFALAPGPLTPVGVPVPNVAESTQKGNPTFQEGAATFKWYFRPLVFAPVGGAVSARR